MFRWIGVSVDRCFGGEGGELGAGAEDMLHDGVNLAVGGRKATHLPRARRNHLSDVAHPGADVKHRRPDRQDVVNLGRMHQADKGIAHDDDVQVRRG